MTSKKFPEEYLKALNDLTETKAKIKKLNSIIEKKQIAKGYTISPVKTIAVGGLPLQEFICKPSKIKVQTTKLLNDKFLKKPSDPRPVDAGSKIDRIRSKQAFKTLLKQKVEEQEQLAKQEEQKKEYKERHKVRSIGDLQELVAKGSIRPSMFPGRYVRGELPCTIEHGGKGHYLSWACPLENLDYTYYLPVFFDGLQCEKSPSDFLARQGVEDLLLAVRGKPARVIPCVKNCVRFIRYALGTFKPPIVLAALKAIQQLVSVGPGVGEELLPYSKIFLGPISSFLDMARNIGDQIDYGQRRNDDIGEEALKTLEFLEEHGGPRAFELIKTSVPTCNKNF